MDVTCHDQESVRIVVPSGRLDSNTAPDFETALMGSIEETSAGVVIDFSQLDYVSSAGLRIFLMAAKRMKAASRKLSVCEMSNAIHDVFRISGFLPLFKVLPGRDEAVSAVKN